MHFVDEHYEVMTANLTKRFVDQRSIRLASERVAKFSLEHGKRALHVRALMVMLQKLFPFEHEAAKHLLQQG